jgi:ParB-like chromosome segregation protein Spo0J
MDMKIELKEVPKWKELFPRPSREQYEALKHDIAVHGQLEPITVVRNAQGNLLIVDGYTRYQICRELGKEPKFIVNENLRTEEDVIHFIRQKNALRRNLSTFARIESVLKCYNALMESANKGRPRKNVASGNNFSETRLKMLAIQVGVNRTTLHKALYILKHGDEALKEELRQGKVGINRAYQKLRKSMTQQPQQPRQSNKDNWKYRIVECPHCGKPFALEEVL